MVDNNIKSETELFGIAYKQKKVGKKIVEKNFVLSYSTKALSELLENIRNMRSTSKKDFY